MRLIRMIFVRRSLPTVYHPGRAADGSRILRLLKWLVIAFLVWFAGVMLWELAFWAFMQRHANNILTPLSDHLKDGVRFSIMSVWNLVAFIFGVFFDLLALLYSLIAGYDTPRLPYLAAIAEFFGFGGEPGE